MREKAKAFLMRHFVNDFRYESEMSEAFAGSCLPLFGDSETSVVSAEVMVGRVIPDFVELVGDTRFTDELLRRLHVFTGACCARVYNHILRDGPSTAASMAAKDAPNANAFWRDYTASQYSEKLNLLRRRGWLSSDGDLYSALEPLPSITIVAYEAKLHLHNEARRQLTSYQQWADFACMVILPPASAWMRDKLSAKAVDAKQCCVTCYGERLAWNRNHCALSEDERLYAIGATAQAALAGRRVV